jgi:putative hydrolase of the HAD superfamily
LAIRTVLWDIGGVLLTNGFGRTQRAGFYAALGLDEEDRSEFEKRRVDANWYWERGLIDDEAFFRRTLFFKPRSFTLSDVVKALQAQQKILHPESVALLAAMHAGGKLRLATLNNESRELNHFRLKHFKLEQYFGFFICSAYVREMKPAEGIFRTALDIAGDRPEEVCFIDDTEANIQAAEQAGLVALHFTSPDSLREQLRSLDIRL